MRHRGVSRGTTPGRGTSAQRRVVPRTAWCRARRGATLRSVVPHPTVAPHDKFYFTATECVDRGCYKYGKNEQISGLGLRLRFLGTAL